MAEAQYETRTRTVEETVIVLTLTEDEADALKEELILISGSEVVRRMLGALRRPAAEQPAPSADTFEHDGVTCDLNARYRDRDGDVWRFERRPDGSVRGSWYGTDIGDYHSLLSDVATECGPLTKVTP
ncbi:phiSA1p31-related protein [Streptomyces sp. NPDC091212]|uniref:phiSA1p31-related protein n=1 Tax=Streptomyces sp. NPDC091212 TaxID=3155191 RepID=UPI003425F2B9